MDQRFELLLEPGLGDRVVGLDLDRRHRPGRVTLPANAPAVELAADLGRESGELGPLGAVGDRVLEQGDRLGVRIAVLERPAQGQRGELANLVVLLAVELSRSA